MKNWDQHKEMARGVSLIILDVDGVMTDGGIMLDNSGNEIKRFHVRDGHGIKMAQRVGITIAIITGRRSDVVEVRARELGITEVYQRCLDKVETYEKLKSKLGISENQTAYVGDDIVDIPVMKRVGLSFAVADAEPYVKEVAHMVTERGGGRGAVREVIDFILKARGDWESVTSKYYG